MEQWREIVQHLPSNSKLRGSLYYALCQYIVQLIGTIGIACVPVKTIFPTLLTVLTINNGKFYQASALVNRATVCRELKMQFSAAPVTTTEVG